MDKRSRSLTVSHLSNPGPSIRSKLSGYAKASRLGGYARASKLSGYAKASKLSGYAAAASQTSAATALGTVTSKLLQELVRETLRELRASFAARPQRVRETLDDLLPTNASIEFKISAAHHEDGWHLKRVTPLGMHMGFREANTKKLESELPQSRASLKR